MVLGPAGRNFAAGMSGGIAYVFDESGEFGRLQCNTEMVELEAVGSPEDEQELRSLIENHYRSTESPVALRIMENWPALRSRFVKVMPIDYKRALQQASQEA